MDTFDIDAEWDNFLDDSDKFENDISTETKENRSNIECSSLYISTKTKIAFLNTTINIQKLFWDIPVIPYYRRTNGIIKKQVKFTTFTRDETNKINEHMKQMENNPVQSVISHLDNPESKAKLKYKHVQKISVGTCKKDFINYRTKPKGAFYNCFALIFRIERNGEFKEVHLKLFNTGKIEIPGIQEDAIMYKTFNLLIDTLQPYFKEKIIIDNNKIDTVLINSNFNCGYYINRQNLFEKLKFKYGLISMFDPCSYPGIQSKFYYNKENRINNGVCNCPTKCNKKGKGNGTGDCMEISFMIFRTGSALIVGNCNEEILHIIYNYIKSILEIEFNEINDGIILEEKKKNVKKKTKTFHIEFDG